MQKHQNTSISLRVPPSGESSIKALDFSAYAEIYFSHLAEELVFSKQGVDLVVSGEGYGLLVLQGYFPESRKGAPVLYFADGKRMSEVEIFDFFDQTEEGTLKAAESGGVGEYKHDSGDLVDGVSRLGVLSLPGTAQSPSGRELEVAAGFSDSSLSALLHADIPGLLWSVTEDVLQESGFLNGVFTVPGLSGLTYGIGAGSGNGKYGTFQIAPDGTWSYTPTTDITFMAQSRTYPETFSVLITDVSGNTVEKAITLVIIGENDAPVITAEGAAVDDTALASGSGISGTLSAGDPDEGGVIVGGVRVQGGPSAFLNGNGVDPNQYGTLVVAPDGSWTFAATTPEQRANMPALGPDHTLVVKATVEAEDQYGLAGSGELVITINGTDEAPVPDGTTFFTQVGEDELMPDTGISGILTAHDPEGGPVTFALKDGGQGACGTLALQENGEWTYTCAGDPDVLNVGDVFQEVFTVLVADKDGNTVEKDMVIAVIGQNDAPLPIAATFQHDVFENSLMRNPVLSGYLDARDPEGGEVSYALKSGSASDQYGTFSLAADGAWTYTRTADISFMAVGKTYKKSFTAIITDDNGGSVEKTFTLTISGDNNAPVAVAETFSHTVAEHSLMDDAVTGGRLDAYDAENDDLSYALKPGSATNAYGYFDLAPDGVWTYTRTADIASLPAGRNYEETFIAVITDGKGGKTERAFTLTINGENDAPVITVEDASLDDSFVLSGAGVSGVLSAGAPDGVAGPPRLISASAAVNGSAATLSDYGELAVNPDGTWTFTATTPEQRENILALGPNDALEVTAILESTDDKGATGRGAMTVTINGTDNEPVPTAAAFAAATSEHALMSGTLTGILEAKDPEGGDAMFSLHGMGEGEYGTLSLGQNGDWTYARNKDLTFMAEGELYTERFTISISDGANTVEKEFTLAIAGDNDAPVITATDKSASDTFIASGSALNGTISAFDPDGGDGVVGGVSCVAVSATVNGGDVNPDDYGALQVDAGGAWSFHAETPEQKANVLALGAGDALVVKAALEAADGKATGRETLTVTINGTDDEPVPTAAAFAAATREDALMDGALTGTLEAKDPEGGAVMFFLYGTGKGAYGTLSLNQKGDWTYARNKDLAFMAEGEVYTERFTIYISDLGNIVEQYLIISITGDNDAPVITVTDKSADDSFIASGSALGGTISAFDPDDGDSVVGGVSYGAVSATVNNGDVNLTDYGALYVNADGTWSFRAETPDQKAKVLALGEGDALVVKAVLEAADGKDAVGRGILTVAINGTDNHPVTVGPSFIPEVQEHELMRNIAASGLLKAADPEGGTVAFSLSGDGQGDYGTLQVNADGTWMYTLGENISFLAEGETHRETFTVSLTDGNGKRDEAFTLTINGENDTPVITVEDASSDDAFVLSGAGIRGTISAGDPDGVAGPPRLLSASAAVNGSAATLSDYGELAVNPDGTWTFTATTPEQRENILALGPNDALAITAILESTDDKGATGRGAMTVTINGTDNEPVPTGAAFAAATSEHALMNGTLTGTLEAKDPEGGDVIFSLHGMGKGEYGTLSLGQNGDWTYARNKDLTFMAEGGMYTERFTISISDGANTVEKEFTLTIAGDNNAPVLADHAASVAEEWVSSGVALEGVVTGTDPDEGNAITYSLKDDSVTFAVDGEVSDTDYGTLTVNENGTWTFEARTPQQRENLKALGDGETLVLTASVTGKDTGGLTDESTLTIAVNGFTPEPVTVLRYEDEALGGKAYSGVYTVEGATKYVLENAFGSDSITINMDEDGTFSYSFTEAGENYFSTLNAGSDPIVTSYMVNVTLPNGAIARRTLNIAVSPTNAGNDKLHITKESIADGLAPKIHNPFDPSQSADTSDRTFYLDRSDGVLQGNDTVTVSPYLPNIKVYTYGGNDSLTAAGPMRGSVYDLGGGGNTITLGAMDAAGGTTGNLVRSAAGTILVDGGFVSLGRNVGMLAYNSGKNVIEGELSGQKTAGTVTLSVKGGFEPEAFAMYSENGVNIVRAETVDMTTVSSAVATGMLGEDASGYNRIEAHNVNISVEGAGAFGLFSRKGKGAGPKNVVEASETVTVSAKASGAAIGIQASDAANVVQAGDVSVRAESENSAAIGMAAAKGDGHVGSNSLNASANVSIAAAGKSAFGVLNELGGNPFSRNEVTAGGNVAVSAAAGGSLSYGILNNSGICAVTAGAGVTIEAKSGKSDSGFGIYSAGTTRVTAASKLDILAEGNRAVGVHALKTGEVRLAGQALHLEVLASGGTGYAGLPPSSGKGFNGPGQAGGLLASDNASLRGEFSGTGTSSITVRGTGADPADREIAALCSWASGTGKSSLTLGGAGNTMALGALEISAGAAREVYGLLAFGGENTLRFNTVSVDATSTHDAAYALWAVKTDTDTVSSGTNVIEAGTATISAAGTNAYGLHAQTGASNTVAAAVVDVTVACVRDGGEAVAMKAEGEGAKNIIEGFGSLEATIVAEAGGNATGPRLAAMHAGNGGANTVAGYSSADTHDSISLTGDIYSYNNGTNTITTGAGDDWVYVDGNISGTGNLISTGSGNDTIHLNGAVTGLAVQAGSGIDMLVLEAESAVLFGQYYGNWIPRLLENTSHGIERIAVMGVSLDDLGWYVTEITKYNISHPGQKISLEYVVKSFSQSDPLESKAAFVTPMWEEHGESGQYASLADVEASLQNRGNFGPEYIEDALSSLSASALEAAGAVDFTSEAPGELFENVPHNTFAMNAEYAYGDILLSAPQTELSSFSKDGEAERALYPAALSGLPVETGVPPADGESGSGAIWTEGAMEDAGGGYFLTGLTDLLEKDSLEELLLGANAPESGDSLEYIPEEYVFAQESEEVSQTEYGMAEQAVTAYYQQSDALESDIMFMIHTQCV